MVDIAEFAMISFDADLIIFARIYLYFALYFSRIEEHGQSND
jgi:hypothetical protein